MDTGPDASDGPGGGGARAAPPSALSRREALTAGVRILASVALAAWLPRAAAQQGGGGDSGIPRPRGLCFGPDGLLFATALVPGAGYDLVRLAPDGTSVDSMTFGTELPGGPLNLPTRVLRFNDDTLAVAETNACRVRFFGLDGSPGRIIGGPGFTPGFFHYPTGLAVHDGLLWVSDTGNHRVQRLDRYGSVEGSVGMLGDAPERLRRPGDVAVMPDGTLAVLDAGHSAVKTFDRDGRLRGVLPLPAPPGGAGPLAMTGIPDSFDLLVAVDGAGLWRVDGRGGSRVLLEGGKGRGITALASDPAGGRFAAAEASTGRIHVFSGI